MTRELARLRLKTWICAPLVVLSGVLGNYFMKLGMPAALVFPFDYVTVLFRPYVALGVVLLILWLLSRMALLSWADLSYVVPVTSIGYALTALAGQLFLHENVDWKRWTGIAMIVAGVALVGGFSAPRTFEDGAEEGRRRRLPHIPEADHIKRWSAPLVGRTPWSAADAPVGRRPKAGQGAGRRPGGPPHNSEVHP